MRALDLENIGKTIDGTVVLSDVSWIVEEGEHWAVIGPNGSGKSTLLRVAGFQLHPTLGRVHVLGVELGRADVRQLRAKIGLSSASLVDQLRGSLTAEEVVRCGQFAALEPWWHKYEPAHTERAIKLLADVGLAGFEKHTFASLSSGERQRALLARTMMANPSVVLLDEPTAGLDFVGRESLITALDDLALLSDGPATVLVTHHLEDIPGSTTHLLAMAEGRVVAKGPIDEIMSSSLLTEIFGMTVAVDRIGQRWSARADS